MIKTIILSLLLLIILLSVACHQDFSPLSPEMVIREAADLSSLSLPSVDPPYILKKAGQSSVSEYFYNDQVLYLVRFKYEWQRSADQIVNIDLTVAESYEMAVDLLKMEWETSSIYHGVPRPQDHPSVAGTISYENGRTFIRDNIIIKNRVLNDSTLKFADLARITDQLLLKAPTHSDLHSVRPSIRKFEIVKNPVPLWSSTKLNIAVIDPLGYTLSYDWRFQPNFGGIWKEADGYYFKSYMDDPTTIFLRLIVFNRTGFSSWSEIKIDIKK